MGWRCRIFTVDLWRGTVKLSAQMTMYAAAVFAFVCFCVAINGMFLTADLIDPQQVSDARGFAGFWVFLGMVMAAFSLLAWWMVRTKKDGDWD